MRRVLPLIISVFSLVFASRGADVRVLIGGGLLGKLDGFCEIVSQSDALVEHSCPPGRSPLGGLYGLQQEIQGARTPNTYVLLTGNNLPKNFNAFATNSSFITELKRLVPDVVAVGQDDLLRAVFPAKLAHTDKPPSRFVSEVQDFFRNSFGKGLPLLASNAAVRVNQKGLNKTWVKGYELMIAADQSIPWTTKKLAFAVPHERRKKALVSLQLAGGGPVVLDHQCVDIQGGSGSVSVRLVPGQKYELIVDDENVTAAFHFQVDSALTPWNSNPKDLAGLPGAWVAHSSAAPVFVAALIDPAALDILDPSTWKDRDTDGSKSLILYPPAEAAKYLLAALPKDGAVPILLTDLNDGLAAQVASASSQWRVITFGGDSHLLGCESGEKGCTKGRGDDYNSGSVAIIDKFSPRFRVFARPEWVGETLIEVSAKSPGESGWQEPSVRPRSVLGGRYTTHPDQAIQIEGKQVGSAREFRLMFANPKDPAKRIWWKSRDDMAVVLMDSMRNSLKTDLAFADERFIDSDVIAELVAMADASMITQIGVSELLEILWRHDPYTVIKLTGKDLVGALGKLAKIPADDDSGGICTRGLGGPQFQQSCSLPDTVKSNVLEVNGRYFNPDEYYSIALPQSLARAGGLAYPRNEMVNVFNTVLPYISTLTPEKLDQISPEKPAASACEENQPTGTGAQTSTGSGVTREFARQPSSRTPVRPLAEAPTPAPPLTWPNLLERKLKSLLLIPPAAIEFGGQNYSVPDRQNKPDTSGFAAIPLVGEKAQHTAKFNMVGELHIIPIDTRYVSLDLFSRVNLNRLETFPNSPSGFLQFSYTPDQWTNGAALRSKIVTDAVTKALGTIGRRILPTDKRPSLRIQPFVGYFDDSSIFHYTATYSRKVDGATFQESDAKPNYAYLGLGLEISPITLGKYFSLTGTRMEQDWGINYAAPKGVSISGQFFGMDDIRRCGVQNLLDGSQGCAAAPLNGPSEIRYHYATERQSRQQLVTSLVFAVGPDTKKETFSLDIKANHWGQAPGGYTPLDPVRSAEFIFKSSFPVGAGITFGPYFRYLTVNAFGSDGSFISRRFGFMLTIPLTAKTGQSRFFF